MNATGDCLMCIFCTLSIHIVFSLYIELDGVESGSCFNFFRVFFIVSKSPFSPSLSCSIHFPLSQHKMTSIFVCVCVCVCAYLVVVVVENGFSPLTCQTNNNTWVYAICIYRMDGINILENLCLDENDKWNFIRVHTHTHNHTVNCIHSNQSNLFWLLLNRSHWQSKSLST